MKYLVYDTSTSGKPASYKVDPIETHNWPRLIHLGWILFDENYKQIDFANEVIRPQGFTINKKSAEFYKVDEKRIEEKGKPVIEVLKKFDEAVKQADILFTFNESFNKNVLMAEYYRAKLPQKLQAAESYCIMQESTYFVGIKGRGGKLKWPTLTELYYSIFNKMNPYPNDAFYDTIATAKCTFVLKDAGELDI